MSMSMAHGKKRGYINKVTNKYYPVHYMSLCSVQGNIYLVIYLYTEVVCMSTC